MRALSFVILFMLFAGSSSGQHHTAIGRLNLINARVTNTDTVNDVICGHVTKLVRLAITARSKVQLSCNYGSPEDNEYDTVANKIFLYYAYDSKGRIRTAILDDIEKYVTQQEEFAGKYNVGKDFSLLPFNKTFIVSKDYTIPFIWTGAERPGDYQVFYLDNQVYKIALAEGKGFGSLSSFTGQNMYFTGKAGRIEMGKRVKNTDTVRLLLSKK